MEIRDFFILYFLQLYCYQKVKLVVRLNSVAYRRLLGRRLCVRAYSPAATACLPWRYRHRRRYSTAAWLFGWYKNVHIAPLSCLPDIQNARILSHRNISCRASEPAPFFRTMNMTWQSVVRPACVTVPCHAPATTSWSDQVKIATLLFTTLFYNEELVLTPNSLLISLQLVIWFAAEISPEVSKTNFETGITGV